MASQEDVVASLPQLQFGLLDAVPCSDVSYEFDNPLPAQEYPFVPVPGHQDTGRGPITTTVKLHFINTLQQDLYPDAWVKWRAVLLGPANADDLIHPDLGFLRARVKKGSVKLTAQSRAGVEVDVTFVETNEDPDAKPATFKDATVALTEYTDAVLEAGKAINLNYPKIVWPPNTDLLGFINQISGAIYSAGLSVSGEFSRAIAGVQETIDGVERLGDPNSWPAIHNLEVLNAALVDISNAVSPRPTATVKVPADISPAEFADAHPPNNLSDIASLNPFVLGKPTILAGTTVTYYKK